MIEWLDPKALLNDFGKATNFFPGAEMQRKNSIGKETGPRPSLKAAWFVCLLFFAAILSSGCATENATAVKGGLPASLITDFLTVEDFESFSVIVKGDHPLAFTAIKQNSPPAVYLQFPQTGLDRSAAGSFTPQSDFIEAIRATESKENVRETRVFIDLKREMPYNVSQEGNDLRIVFTKIGTSQAKKVTGAETASVATILKKVIVTPSAKGVSIRVIADGMVQDYRTFTIEIPPKIVVDCFGLQSNYERQQKIPVKSSIVTQVRHFAHPDKIRVVAETQSIYLNSYRIEPAADGFVVRVGK